MSKKSLNRKYDNFELVAAAKMVNEQKMSIYRAAKINEVKWSSLIEFCNIIKLNLFQKWEDHIH